MDFLVKPVLKLADIMFYLTFKGIMKQDKYNYLIREASAIYIVKEKDDEIDYEDITDEIGTGPVAEMLLELIEKNIVKTGIKVKYRCTRCKETLVDSKDELTPYGGLGYWCQSCIEACEETNE